MNRILTNIKIQTITLANVFPFIGLKIDNKIGFRYPYRFEVANALVVILLNNNINNLNYADSIIFFSIISFILLSNCVNRNGFSRYASGGFVD